MEKRKDIEAAGADSAPEKISTNSELPTVESPSISPAEPEAKIENLEPIAEPLPAIEPAAEITPAPETATESPAAPVTAKILNFTLRPRHKRYVALAASVAIAAVLGGVVGAMTGGSTPPPAVTAGLEEQKAMRQTLAQLNKEVATLKTNLDAANKAAHSQIAKITERFDRAASAELVTGSISAPQTTAPAAAPVPAPLPRPAPKIAMVETQAPPSRSQIVQNWTIRDTRDGFVYVQNNNGEVYQVQLGVPLPGLGPVESVKRPDGRWVITTPKGIIVSMRDRRYFE
jgi:hypothetical protein